MVNADVAVILTGAKEMDKWVLIKDIMQYGLFYPYAMELEDRGLVVIAMDMEGYLLKLTLDGYNEAKAFLENIKEEQAQEQVEA